jgi:hypothetical protein
MKFAGADILAVLPSGSKQRQGAICLTADFSMRSIKILQAAQPDPDVSIELYPLTPVEVPR